MGAPKGNSTYTSLFQLRQTFSYETTILLIRIRSIKKITTLHEKIYTLYNGKISRLLKSPTQTLLPLLTPLRLLPKSRKTQVIISGQNQSHNIIVLRP